MMPSIRRFAVLVLLLSLTGVTSGFAQQSTSSKRLTIEQLMDIKHPSDPVWSPDGSHVAFLWDRAGVTNVYLAGVDGSGEPAPLTKFTDGHLGNAFWSHNSKTVYFDHDGSLWQAEIAGGEPQPVWQGKAGERGFALSPDGTRVALVRGGDAADDDDELVVRSLADGAETRVAQDAVSISRPLWAPDGAHIAYISGAKIVHHNVSPDYSGAKLIYSVEEYQPGQLMVISSSGGKAVVVGTRGRYDALAWLDASRLVFARQSDHYKRRTIYVAAARDGSTRAIHEDVEKDFWSLPDWEAGPEPAPSPDGHWIAFLSDQDGWDHIYVVSSAGGQAVQITKGRFEAWRPAWSHDSTRIAFDANEPDHSGDRRLGIATLGKDPRQAKIEYITTGTGTNIAPRWSDDDRRLVYQHTDVQNSADLYAMDAKAGAKPARVTGSTSFRPSESASPHDPSVRYGRDREGDTT